MQRQRIAVVLFQLGGPDSLDAVEPFLYNLFCDPDIIDLPLAFLFRRRLANIIARKRAPLVQEYYRRIGGKSPILKITQRQARALEEALHSEFDATVYIAMRYWHPLTDVAVEKLSSDHVRKVVLLPLYPQYSVATSGSSFHEWERSVARNGLKDLEVSLVEEYCDHPLYIAALVRNITLALQRVPTAERSRIHLVFSAHGTPIKLVKRGDPYEAQIIRTVNAVVKAGKFGLPHVLCYQSKVGPQRWLEPSLDDTIKKLAAEKTTHLLVVPIAFVSDHIETLWEINIESREEARNLGIQYFDVVPALNSSPLFIEALADIVRKKVTRS